MLLCAFYDPQVDIAYKEQKISLSLTPELALPP